MAELVKPSVKHFVFINFFPAQVRQYLYNVLAPKFLEMQLPLAKNSLSSLENQTDKNFEVIFYVNPKFVDNPEYEFIFTTLKNSTTLPIKFISSKAEWESLIKEAMNGYDFVIESKMDLDDFVFKGAIEDIKSKVPECDSVLTYGYTRGYVYVEGELWNYIQNYYIGLGYSSIFYSLIIRTSAVKEWPFGCLDITRPGHNKVKPTFEEIYAKNNLEFKDSMFRQNSTTDAYIYFRHDFTREKLVYNRSKIPKIPKLTTADITKKQLEEEFGFSGYELKSIE